MRHKRVTASEEGTCGGRLRESVGARRGENEGGCVGGGRGEEEGDLRYPHLDREGWLWS